MGRSSRDGRDTVQSTCRRPGFFLDAVRACPSHIGLEHEKPAQRAAFMSPWCGCLAWPVSDALRAVCAVPRCRLFYALRCPVPLRQRETYGSYDPVSYDVPASVLDVADRLQKLADKASYVRFA